MMSVPLRFSRFDDLLDPGLRPQAELRRFAPAAKPPAPSPPAADDGGDGCAMARGHPARPSGSV